MNQHERQFIGLDGLRGAAAFVVVFLHGTLFITNVNYTPEAACLVVDFFFMLSSFVVANAYDNRLENSMTWHQFMTIRLVRLYLMLFVSTTMGALIYVLPQVQKHELNVLIALFITTGSFALFSVGLPLGTLAYPINVAAWSLFFEFSVNALYGSRFGRLSIRPLVAFVVVSEIAMIPMALWDSPYIQIGFGTLTAFLLGFFRVTFPFWAGVLLFRVCRVLAMPSFPISIVGLALVLLLLAAVNNPIYNVILVLIVFPIFLQVSACASVGIQTARECSVLGRLSYPLYLVNVPVFRLVDRTADRMHVDISPWILIIGGSVLSVIVAETFQIAFDEPVRSWLSHMRCRRNTQVAL